MFPFQQNDNQFWPQIPSNPNQEDVDLEDLIGGQDPSLHGNSEEESQMHKILAASSNANDSGNIVGDEKKPRKEIERERRQQMSALHASLRNLLPLESIKGNRSMSDHMNVAAKYIKHLKSNIRELSVKRDKLKNLSNSSSNLEQGTVNSDHNLVDCVTVCPYLGGIVEIVVSRGSGEEGILLSRVLEAVFEEGFEVLSCISTRKDGKHLNTIKCQVCDQTCIDVDGLQRKLNYVVSLSG